MLASIEHGPVFGDRGYDVITLPAVHLGHTLDRQIVALGGCGCKNNKLGARSNQIGNSLPSYLYSFLSGPPEGMIATGSIAEVIGEVRQHFLEYAWIDGRSGVVVHIDREFDPVRTFPHLKPGDLGILGHP